MLPDYLAIGSNQDFVRIPMTPLAAQRLADLLGCSLPTRKPVDAIFRQADVRVPPSPSTASWPEPHRPLAFAPLEFRAPVHAPDGTLVRPEAYVHAWQVVPIWPNVEMLGVSAERGK